MNSTAMWLIGQTIVVVGSIFVAYVRLAVKVARVETNTETLKGDHANLATQVQGISRSVGRLEGQASK